MNDPLALLSDDDIGLAPGPAPNTVRKSPNSLIFTPVENWEGITPEPRRWLVRDRLPLGAVSLLQGDGAAGKTTIALQLLVSTVIGTDWLGAVVEHSGPAMFLSAEEDDAEIHRRLDRIARQHQRSMASLRGIHVLGLVGEDALLAGPDQRQVLRPAPLLARLESAVSDIKPALIVLETAADLFGGNENDRAQVRQFIAICRRLTLPSDAAVLLLGHPSLAGLSSGTGTSGSTGWNNSVRSRLYFASVKAKGDDEPDKELRELQVMKSNYGPAGEKIRLRWRNGVFVPDNAPASLEQLAAERDIDAAFLACLDARTAQGIDLSVAKQSHSYAPTLFEGMKQAAGARKSAFSAAMDRLLADGRLELERVGPPSKSKQRLVRGKAAQ